MKPFRRILISFLLIFFPLAMSAQTVRFSPEAPVVYDTDVSYIDVTLTSGAFINAVEVYIDFDPQEIAVLDILVSDSVVDLWVSEPHADDGTITMIGGISGGSVMQNGHLATLAVQGKATGNTALTVDTERSGVYLNDGLGTRVPVESQDMTIVLSDGQPIESVIVQSPTHPDQSAWYPERTVRFAWDALETDQFSYSFSRTYGDLPDSASEGSSASVEFKNVEDGIWYFTIQKQIGASTWSDVTRRRVLVDGTPPEDFTAQLIENASEFDGKDTLVFWTTDAMSGIEQYRVEEDADVYAFAVSPHIIRHPNAKTYTVRAFDRAGNETFSTLLFADGGGSDHTLMYVVIGLSILFSGIIVARLLYPKRTGKA